MLWVTPRGVVNGATKAPKRGSERRGLILHGDSVSGSSQSIPCASDTQLLTSVVSESIWAASKVRCAARAAPPAAGLGPTSGYYTKTC
jgi:hypothetical protein